MTAKQKSRETALSCLREIAKLLPQGTNLEAWLDGAPESDSEMVVDFAKRLKLNPEHRTDVDPQELAAYFGAPVLLRLRNDNWVLFLGVRTPPGAGERFAMYDPISDSPSKQVAPDENALKQAWNGEAVFLRNMNNPNFSTDGRHTALYSFVAIAKHHGVAADINRLLHNYAISEDEPSSRLLTRIADDSGITAKKTKAKWSDFDKFGDVYPFLGYHKDGTAAVICGTRKREKDGFDLAIWDPVKPEGKNVQIEFITQEEYEEKFSGDIVLCKRRYSITDED